MCKIFTAEGVSRAGGWLTLEESLVAVFDHAFFEELSGEVKEARAGALEQIVHLN